MRFEIIPTKLRGPNPPPTTGVFISYDTLDNYYFNICKHEMEKWSALTSFIEQFIIHSGNVDATTLISSDWRPLEQPRTDLVIDTQNVGSQEHAVTTVRKRRTHRGRRAGDPSYR